MLPPSMPSNIYSRYISITYGDLSPESILKNYGIVKDLVAQGGLQFPEVRATFENYVMNMEESKACLEEDLLLKDFCQYVKARLDEYNNK